MNHKARIERTPLDMAKLWLTRLKPAFDQIQHRKTLGNLTAREMAEGVRLSHDDFESLYVTLHELAREVGK